MSKKDIIEKLTNILSAGLRHKIGSIVNTNEIYAQRYAKDAESLLNEAKRVSKESNWNSYDKEEIRKTTKAKLKHELEIRDFIDKKKFEIIDKELEEALKYLGL